MIAIDPSDQIVKCMAQGADAEFIENYKALQDYPANIPVIFRSMTQRKTVALCDSQHRDYYYIDTGYIGNLEKRKNWHRVVLNGMQHSSVRYDLPSDRFNLIAKSRSYLPFTGWKKTGRSILVVTPSEKPCKFYGINRDEWVNETLATISKYTDRPVIVRDKGLRRERIRENSIYSQIDENDVFAVVTYNSIAATEAIGYGIPAFTAAPNAADPFCLKDLSKIETPLYEAAEKVIAWQNWLGYCQYTTTEMTDGVVLNMIKEYDLK